MSVWTVQPVRFNAERVEWWILRGDWLFTVSPYKQPLQNKYGYPDGHMDCLVVHRTNGSSGWTYAQNFFSLKSAMDFAETASI